MATPTTKPMVNPVEAEGFRKYTERTDMKAFSYFILVLALPLIILGCVSIDIGGDCTYGGDGRTEGEPVKEVTDSLGDVYKVETWDMEIDGDALKFCGVSRQAKPKQVGDKYFFTFNGVDIEAEDVEQIAWDLVTTRIE